MNNAVSLLLTHDHHTCTLGEMYVESTSPVVAPGGGSFCLGAEVNFTCQVEDTERLVWKSSEYIGRGGSELAFGTVSSKGDERANGLVSGTYALLVSTGEGGRINSTLHLRIQFNGSVSCIADPPGNMTNITISIAGKYMYYKHTLGSLMAGIFQTPDSPSCRLGGMETTTNREDSTTSTAPPSNELETIGNNSKS